MATYREKSAEYSYLKRRSRSNFLSSIVSIGLVLFLLGTFATLALFTKTFTRSVKESIGVRVSLYDGVSRPQLQAFMDSLLKTEYVLDARYVSKEEAARQYLEHTGEDLLESMDGINPLLPEVRLRLREAYLHPDSINQIREVLSGNIIVADVILPARLLPIVNQNANTLSYIALLVGALAILVALYLIFGTIRLAVYAKRLTIRSMQLIGATRSFIRRPFLIRGLSQGFLASLLACAILIALISFLDWRLSILELADQDFFNIFLIGILGGIVLFGTALGLLGSYMAVNRFLGQNLDELMK
jgi:cell division transport system permease protein